MNPIIKVESLSKKYRLGEGRAPYGTLRESLMEMVRAPLNRLRSGSSEQSMWALRDVSFEVWPGEVVGIIGRNGAGKSTLLKVLSRITEPTAGRVELYGRVGSLLEVGTGFHPELTGRENIYLNGAILGMRRAEIERLFDRIVAFAEVEKFIDTPVKRYSSGMYLRLAFAVAAHLEPEILFVDEVLAVGDVSFQKKCLQLMDDVARAGRTVLLVSHNMGAIESLCRSAFLLDRGRLVLAGETRQVIDTYLASMKSESGSQLDQRTDRRGDGKLRFTDLYVRNTRGEPIDIIQCGRDVEFALTYTRDRKATGTVSIYICVFTLSGQWILLLGNEMLGTDFDAVPETGEFSCAIERFPLLPGQYSVTLFCTLNGIITDWVEQATEITVEAGDFYGTGRLPPNHTGGVLIPHSWRITS